MEKTIGKRTLIGWFMLPFIVVVLAFPFIEESRLVLPIFDLRFNAYAMLDIAGAISSLISIGFLVRKQTKANDNLWLIASVSGMVIFSLGEALQRLAANPEASAFWGQILGIGIGVAPALMFLFALDYTRPERRSAFFTTCVLIGTAFFIFFQANGGLLFQLKPSAISLYPWGYDNKIGPAYATNFLWFAVFSLAALIVIYRFGRQTANKVLKTQSTIFSVAILFPLSAGIIVDSILPLIGVKFLPPLTGVFLTVTGVALVYGVIKYKVFEFSPSILSQSILSTMHESVIVTNNDLEVEFVNDEATRLLNLSSAAAMRRTVASFFDNHISVQALHDRLQSEPGSSILPIEDLTMSQNGKTKYLRILVAPVLEGHRREGYIFVISDITELKQAYMDLETAKAGVEHTVEIRTRELREAQAKLLEMDKLKTEFIMLASHNLRTPLTSIEGYADVLSDTNLDQKQRESLNRQQVSIKRLGKLVNDLLTITTIESGQQQLASKPIKANEFLEPLVNETKANSDPNENTFTAKIDVGDALINASTDRLKAAISSILDNSFRFTRNGRISLEADIEDHKLVIKVKDSGIGIKAEEIPKLFTKFHRGSDTLEYNYEGEGIGLYLTKLVVAEHSGTIDIQSKENVGTTVTIKLPLAELPAEPAVDAPERFESNKINQS